jgi:CRP/FNR family transcriptional regulator
MDEKLSARRVLAPLDGALIDEMVAKGRIVDLPADTPLLREGAYVKELPVVVDGLVRVYMDHEGKELLLYYIEPSESCVMSFSALLGHLPSRVNAVTEAPTKLLLVSESDVRNWLRTYPTFAELMFRLYHERYTDLLHTMEQVAFGDLPSRLLEHLEKLARLRGSKTLDVRHAKLALELGSAREVITRTLGKLEREGRIALLPQGIRLER